MTHSAQTTAKTIPAPAPNAETVPAEPSPEALRICRGHSPLRYRDAEILAELEASFYDA